MRRLSVKLTRQDPLRRERKPILIRWWTPGSLELAEALLQPGGPEESSSFSLWVTRRGACHATTKRVMTPWVSKHFTPSADKPLEELGVN